MLETDEELLYKIGLIEKICIRAMAEAEINDGALEKAVMEILEIIWDKWYQYKFI